MATTPRRRFKSARRELHPNLALIGRVFCS